MRSVQAEDQDDLDDLRERPEWESVLRLFRAAARRAPVLYDHLRVAAYPEGFCSWLSMPAEIDKWNKWNTLGALRAAACGCLVGEAAHWFALHDRRSDATVLPDEVAIAPVAAYVGRKLRISQKVAQDIGSDVMALEEYYDRHLVVRAIRALPRDPATFLAQQASAAGRVG